MLPQASANSSVNSDQLRFKAILATTRSMLAVLDPDSALRTLVEMIRELDGPIASAVWEYDEADSYLRIRCAAGLSEEYVRSGAVAVGAKAVGRAFESRDLVMVGDVGSDPSFTISLPRLQGEGIYGIVGAPLVARDKLLGILAVYFPASLPPSQYETDTIRTLANLAALAIDNARLYQAQVRSARELEAANRLLAEKSEVLSQSLKIHDWLIQTVLVRDGIEAVAGALAEFAQTHVVVEDDHLNLLCVSDFRSASAGNGAADTEDVSLSRFADDPRVRQHLARVTAERRPQFLGAIPEIGLLRPRIVAPVFTGNRLLGFVYIIGSDRPFDTLDFVLSEQGAVAIALEMTKRKAAFEVEQKVRASLLRSLLAGDMESLEGFSSVQNGKFDLGALQAVLLVRRDQEGIPERDRSGQVQVLDSHAYGLIERLVVGTHPKTLLVFTKDVLVVLAGSERKLSEPALRKLGEQIVSALNKHLAPMTVSVGVGGLCQHPRDLRRSFAEASKSLDAAAVLGKRGAVVTLADLGIFGAILRRGDLADVQEIVGRYISPILEYDRQHRTDLLLTLAAYVRNNYRLDETARELFVHVKTVKYRLQRIEQLSGVALNDSEDFLSLQVALRLHQLLTGVGSRAVDQIAGSSGP